MAISFRYKKVPRKLHLLLSETEDVSTQPTVHMPASRRKARETDKLPQLAFYHVKESYPLMKVVRAIAQWMEENDTPPRFIGLNYPTLGKYWLALRMPVYYYRMPDGSLFTVELVPMNLPDMVVYCSTGRP